MATTFTYQMSGCVLITPQYVPEIVTNREIVDAAGGIKHTQAIDTPDVELAVYGTLQVVNSKQPPQQGNISVTQPGSESIARLEKVAIAAFRLALKEQRATAMGINFVTTTPLAKPHANAVLFGLLDSRIAKLSANAKGNLRTVGLKLIFDYEQWVATLSVEADPNDEKLLVSSVNFNINSPLNTNISLIRHASKLRTWFEQTVSGIIGKDSNV
jgi:hypothetical protein